MLVIISDLHLTDGTSGSTISPGAFELLHERLVDLAVGASHRRDGAYRPVDKLDVVLLGDVLDVIRSSRWLAGQVRPWDDPRSPELFATVSAITEDVLRRNAFAMETFRSLAQQCLPIPAATREGRPDPRELAGVAVRIHYMVGNHDWFFHLPGASYDQLRMEVARQMGLAASDESPFAHEPWENNELLQTLRRHKVFARHGDVFDPFNFEGDRNASSLGDAIVIELLSRFSVQVERELSEELPASAIAGLREIDNIRPLLLIPVWIEGLLERTCPQPGIRQKVKQIWNALAEEFLEHPFVRARDTWRPLDLVDGLQRALVFSRRISVGWASSIAQWLAGLRGADSNSYVSHALGEQDFRNRRARHIVYGHTHHAEQLPLDASSSEGYVLQQTYFNSGTWRRVYEQTRLAPQEHEFVAADNLTYLAFFKDDERGGRPYETWTGTLGLAPQGPVLRRTDSPTITYASGEPISTPSVPLRAPHFAVPIAPVRVADAAYLR
jgi:UDP-2,3-diacylglucosamine pyrophosphatase LpxH